MTLLSVELVCCLFGRGVKLVFISSKIQIALLDKSPFHVRKASVTVKLLPIWLEIFSDAE